MRSQIKLGVAALLAVAAPSYAQASTTATTNFAVTATVLSSCTVTALPLVFGNYNPTQSTATTGQTTLSVLCTNGTSYTVGLNAGTGSGATVANRKMTFGANTLNYTLYQDSTYSTLWGNTVGTDTKAGTGNGLLQSINVYGQAPAMQSAPLGAYTDTVTVTLTY